MEYRGSEEGSEGGSEGGAEAGIEMMFTGAQLKETIVGPRRSSSISGINRCKVADDHL